LLSAPVEHDMMIHDDPWLALLFFFYSLVHEIARHPSRFLPALIVVSMLAYIGFEFIRAFLRQRRRLADAHHQEPPQDLF
jgi:hypothetical protein